MSKDFRRSEIRRILLGYIDFDADGNLIAAERSERIRTFGTFNGTAVARIMGVSVHSRYYAFSKKPAEIEEDCLQAFRGIGRLVRLDSAEDILTVFSSPVFFNPTVLTAEIKGERLLVSVYTARSLTSWLNASRAFRQWRRHMPADLREKDTAAEKARNARKKRQSAADSEKRKKQKRQKKTDAENRKPEKNE